MSLAVIYIHGFNSSPQSIKAQQIQTYFEQHKLAETKNYQLHIPALNYQPGVAIIQLETLIEAHLAKCKDSAILLIGSSLGGFYSIWLAQKYPMCKAVLVNPAVYPYLLLKEWLGENENIYTEQKYLLTYEHMQQLEALDVKEINDPQRILLFSQKGDETLDYREAVEKLATVEQHVEEGGNHSYENFPAIIKQIFDFAE